jgi:hypothetical protein
MWKSAAHNSFLAIFDKYYWLETPEEILFHS